MTHMIEAKNIVNRFGAQVVHDGVNLTLEKGEILGLVGGSGSGKSVLLRTLLGLHKPTGGMVEVMGKDIYRLSGKERTALQRRWGVLFQDGALFSNLSVLDNVAFPMREHTALKEDAVRSLSQFKLGLVELDAAVGQKSPSDLSGGMAKRVALARALALDPELLFLDEPSAGLDPMTAAAFDELILSLRRVLGLSVLVITHDLDTLSTICDRIAMLVRKKLVVGTMEEMLASKDPDIREYFNGPRMRAATRKKA